jgi:hypothetical protein
VEVNFFDLQIHTPKRCVENWAKCQLVNDGVE